MRVSVLWSGGLDSTYLIYDHLKKGDIVDAFYIDIKNNLEKSKKEKAAIESLSKYFFKNFPGYFFNVGQVIAIDVKFCHDNFSLHQAPIWILSSLFTVGLESTDQIEIAYVMNDDAISYLDEIRKAYESLYPFIHKKYPLVFPLSKTKKEDELQFLPKELLENITVCETETEEKFCGKCASCKRLRNTLDNTDRKKELLYIFKDLYKKGNIDGNRHKQHLLRNTKSPTRERKHKG